MRDPDGCFWGGYCCLHHQWLLGPTHSPFLRFQDPGPQSLLSCPPSRVMKSQVRWDLASLFSSGMSADLSRPAACRAGPGCQPHLPIPTLLRLVSSLTGLSRLPCRATGGGLASFSLAAVSSLHESRTRPAEVPFQKQHKVKKELRSTSPGPRLAVRLKEVASLL